MIFLQDAWKISDICTPYPGFQFVRETINNALVLDRLTSEADVVVHLARQWA